MKTDNVTRSDIALLQAAIEMAAEWRGNRHPDEHEDFDEMIDDMHRALIKVDKARKEFNKSRAKP